MERVIRQGEVDRCRARIQGHGPVRGSVADHPSDQGDLLTLHLTGGNHQRVSAGGVGPGPERHFPNYDFGSTQGPAPGIPNPTADAGLLGRDRRDHGDQEQLGESTHPADGGVVLHLPTSVAVNRR
jgi:hypothetical protein